MKTYCIKCNKEQPMIALSIIHKGKEYKLYGICKKCGSKLVRVYLV